MKRWYLALTLGIGLVWAGSAAAESPRRVLPPPARAAAEKNPDLAKYLDKLEVRSGKTHKGLTVYPLVARQDFPLESYLTLDEALKRKALEVKELEGGAQVNTILLENTSDQHVFILAGEVLKGAKQDRTIQSDLLVPPRSGKLQVDAFCTEQGRWVQKTSHFEAADVAVPNSVRKAAKQAKQQGAVWDNIARAQAKLGVSAPTGAAKEVYESRSVKEGMKPYFEHLADVPKLDPHTVGVAATFGDKLVALDVFGDDHLFGRLYSKLLGSYVVDVMGDSWHGTASPYDVKKWLVAASDAAWEKGDTAGVGLGLEFKEPPLSGSALLYKEMVVHSDVFVADKETIQDGPGRPPRLDLRRDRLPVQQHRSR